MSTNYTVNVQRREGKLVAELVREITTVPKSGRGREWSQASSDYHVYTFPVDDLADISQAITNGLISAVEDGIDDESEPRFALHVEHPLLADDDPELFWSVYEARDFVRQARLNGKDVRSWVLRRPDGEPVERYGA